MLKALIAYQRLVITLQYHFWLHLYFRVQYETRLHDLTQWRHNYET